MNNKFFEFIDFNAIAHRTMLNYGFVADFSAKLMREVHAINEKQILEIENQAVRDLRHLMWSSIDNLESKDLDQIEYCERAPNREIHVMVAIADVDAFAPKSSLVDRHAHHNGTSVYTGMKNFPMLPDELSADMTSLLQDEDRLAVVIDYFVKKDGSIRFNDVYRSLVCNKAKLVYESVGDWLDGKGVPPEKVIAISGLADQLKLQNEAAERLHQFRMDKGALELETIEAKVVSEDDKVNNLIVRKKTSASYIIENFMIAANQTMSWFLERQGFPSIQRVLRTPERWSRIVQVANTMGESLPEIADPQALSDFLARARRKNPENFPDLSLTIVKLIGQAEYMMTEPGKTKLGHFGLAVQDYIHSTAPNRRYVDLIIQRLLKAALVKAQLPYTKKELSDIASWCTNRGQEAKKVERFMRKIAAMILLKDHLGDVYEAIVTGASDKGTYVRLLSPPAEGRVIRGEHGMDIGEKVKVKLVTLDPEKGFIDFERANGTKYQFKFPAPAPGTSRPRRKK